MISRLNVVNAMTCINAHTRAPKCTHKSLRRWVCVQVLGDDEIIISVTGADGAWLGSLLLHCKHSFHCGWPCAAQAPAGTSQSFSALILKFDLNYNFSLHCVMIFGYIMIFFMITFWLHCCHHARSRTVWCGGPLWHAIHFTFQVTHEDCHSEALALVAGSLDFS